MTLALLAITLIYLYLIIRFVFGFDKVEDFQCNETDVKTAYSVIIPFRNEAKHLPELLQSIAELNYSDDLHEVLLVDDESSDDSLEIISEFIKKSQVNARVIRNVRQTNSPKKDAIDTAISQAQYDWIITTDADCTFDKAWLLTIAAFIQEKQPKMVVAPVNYKANNSFLHGFQTLDFLSLMGATIGGFGNKKPFLCNGANLIYKKDIFVEVNGFSGNDDIASGDDIFIMEKVLRKYPNDVHYLKHTNAIVTTQPQDSFSGLLAQRKRWAAKTSAYSNLQGKLVGSVVLFMNFSIISALFLSVFGVFSLKTVGYVFFIKFSIDLWLLHKTATFFKQQKPLRYYFISSFLYPFFNVYVALSSWFGGYKWKGRRFTK